ncbi:MAG: hypothetical protein AB3X44_14625 [Leptothrix sp. (in: b-proteobacteria)]
MGSSSTLGKKMRPFIVLVAALCSPSIYSKDVSLCTAQEQVLFTCMVKSKTISVCGSHGFNSESGYVQYRYGTQKKIELQYPSLVTPPKGHFWFSSTPYAGGGESRLRFINSGAQYEVFDRTIRTGFGKDGLHYPESTAGVIVFDPGHAYKEILCTTDGTLSSELHGKIETEEFRDDRTPADKSAP